VGTVRYQMTLQELVHSAFRRKMLTKRRLALLAALVAVGALLLAFPVTRSAGFVVILFALLWPLAFRAAIAKLVRRSGILTAPATLAFGDEGLSMVSGDVRIEYGWRAIGRCVEDTGYFFVYLGRSDTALTIPKRAFGPAEMEEFRRHLARVATGAPAP
jgi:hypothetical protein